MEEIITILLQRRDTFWQEMWGQSPYCLILEQNTQKYKTIRCFFKIKQVDISLYRRITAGLIVNKR